MRVYHVSLKANHRSIMAKGVDPAYSRGARAECWFVTPGLLSWAVLHVMQRHKVGIEQVIAYEALVSAAKLTRRRKGIYTCPEVVPALFIVASLEPSGVADSYPADGGCGKMNGS